MIICTQCSCVLDEPNVDFIAVGEHLIESKICKSKTLAIRGGSNGECQSTQCCGLQLTSSHSLQNYCRRFVDG